MNNQFNIIRNDTVAGSEKIPTGPEGYVLLVTTPNIFSMDLVGTNLTMNGIDALWFFPDPVELPDEFSTLFVKAEQKEQALGILASLDLTDFTTTNGQ